MVEYYNQFIPRDKEYASELCFVKINNDATKNICIRDHSYAEFKKDFIKYNGYYASDDALMLRNPKYCQEILEKNRDILNKVSYIRRYLSYVYIIKNEQNPELEGRTMIFYFGYKIFQMLLLEKKIYEHSFNLNIKPINVYGNMLSSYDDSHFSSKEYYIENMDLNLNDKLRYKRIDYNNLDRMFKLQKLLVKMK